MTREDALRHLLANDVPCVILWSDGQTLQMVQCGHPLLIDALTMHLLRVRVQKGGILDPSETMTQ